MDSPAAKTWVLLNFPDAIAERFTKNFNRARPRHMWKIVMPNRDKPWETKLVLSSPGRHPTEYKAWKSASNYMNKVTSGKENIRK